MRLPNQTENQKTPTAAGSNHWIVSLGKNRKIRYNSDTSQMVSNGCSESELKSPLVNEPPKMENVFQNSNSTRVESRRACEIPGRRVY